MIFSTYTISQYRANERGLIHRHSKVRNGEGPLILCFHGLGADANQFGPVYWNGLWPTISALCEAGYVVVSIDAGASLSSWGNADSMTATGLAHDWAQDLTNDWSNKAQAKAGDIGLLGWSMGGLTALNYNVRNLADVAGTYLFSPITDLNAAHDQAGWTASIDTAYGGNFATNSLTYDPSDRMTDFNAGGPIRILHSDDDTTVPISYSEAFDAGTTVTTLVEVTGRGHFPFTDPITVNDVVTFFQGVLPT
jgi:pimeloyl-ACP methyl ester carboxylesterase